MNKELRFPFWPWAMLKGPKRSFVVFVVLVVVFVVLVVLLLGGVESWAKNVPNGAKNFKNGTNKTELHQP